MVAIGDGQVDDLIPVLFRSSLEDPIHMLSMLHGVYQQALMTRTTCRLRLVQLGGHFWHLPLKILNYYTPLTKSALQHMHFCIPLTNLALRPEHLSCQKCHRLAISRSNIQRKVESGDLLRHQTRRQNVEDTSGGKKI